MGATSEAPQEFNWSAGSSPWKKSRNVELTMAAKLRATTPPHSRAITMSDTGSGSNWSIR